jgi:hypothetical protein
MSGRVTGLQEELMFSLTNAQGDEQQKGNKPDSRICYLIERNQI